MRNHRRSTSDPRRAPTPQHLEVAARLPVPSARELNALDLDAHLGDPARKQAFVTPMFEHIAPRYDAFTRLFSFGMDARWKREMMRWLAEAGSAPSRVLDVACGTGDLALAAAKRWPAAHVIGIDAAEAMIERASARAAVLVPRELPSEGDARGPHHPPRLEFTTGDLTHLALDDASVDVVLAGYALRNVPRCHEALQELHRVLRPGGVLLTLDFYRPALAPWRVLFLAYLQLAGSVVGWWWHRAPVIYAYIAHSIRGWLTADEFSAALQASGFAVERRRHRLLGGVALHQGRRLASGEGARVGSRR